MCFLDFSKAFDNIDYTILVFKFMHLGVRGSLIRWICSFRSGRSQAVSEWMAVHAGVPRGTKLGLILFLIMINDKVIRSPLLSNHWKYIDDITISKVMPLAFSLYAFQHSKITS